METSPPIWKWPPFAADLLDPFAESSSLEGGEVLHALVVLDATLKSLLEDGSGLLPFLAQSELAAVESVRAVLEQSAPLAQFALEKVTDEKGLGELVKQWSKLIRELPDGETLFLPGGWKDGVGRSASVMHVVRRTGGGGGEAGGATAAADEAGAAAAAAAADAAADADAGDEEEEEDSDDADLAAALALSMAFAAPPPPPATCSFTTVNPGRDGSDFHRSAARVSPSNGTFYLDYEAALVLPDVPLERAANPVFLATLLSQRCAEAESHRGEILYHALLPWLTGASLLETLVSTSDDDAAPLPGAEGGAWRPQCRAETSSYHCVLEAMRLVLRRAGLAPTQLEQLALAISRELVRRAVRELEEQEQNGAAPGGDDDGCGCGHAHDHAHTHADDDDDDDDAPTIDDVVGAEDPNAPPPGPFVLQRGDSVVLLAAAGQLAKRALVESDNARLDDASLRAVEAEIDALKAAVARTVHDGALASLPPPIGLESEMVTLAPFFDVENLISTGEDQYRGQRIDPPPPTIANMLELPDRAAIRSLPDAIAAIGVCSRICGELLSRADSDEATGSSRLALQHQVIQLICELYTAVLPMPLPPQPTPMAPMMPPAPPAPAGAKEGESATAAPAAAAVMESVPDAACIWTTQQLPKREQVRALKLVYSTVYLLGAVWQDIHEPTRLFDAQRAVTAACALAIFDAVVRTPALDEPLELTELLRYEDGGYSLSLEVGQQISGQALEKASAHFELATPTLARARDAALNYLTAIETACSAERGGGGAIFDLPLVRLGNIGMAVEMRKRWATSEFVRKYVDRVGFPLAPRSVRPQTEMHAIMFWMSSSEQGDAPFSDLARDHPEFTCMRDMVTLHKFLTSMLTSDREAAILGKELGTTRAYRLCFDIGQASTRLSAAREVKTLYWECQTVRGNENHIANLTVHGFGQRKLVWGNPLHSPTLLSPSDVGAMLGRADPTEEDVLHTDDLPRFHGTLSSEESEALLSYLTVGYIRVPLVAHFFADLQSIFDTDSGKYELHCGNRATFLFNEQLQALFRSVILEQGAWVSQRDSASTSTLIDRVPKRETQAQKRAFERLKLRDARVTKKRSTLGSAFGTLINELRCSPAALLQPFMCMLRYTIELGATDVHSQAAGFLFFMLRLAVVIERYLVDAVHGDQSESESDGESDAERAVSAERMRALKVHLKEMTTFLRGPLDEILRVWLVSATNEISRDGAERKGNLPTLVVIHAHIALLYSNLRAGTADASPEAAAGAEPALSCDAVSRLIGSAAFVRGNHCFGQTLRNLELDLDAHADEQKVREVVEAQLRKFLQSQGVNTANLDSEYLRRFLTGDPLWFVSGATVLRVPLSGISHRGAGFAAPPTEVPEDALALVVQQQRRRIVEWMLRASREEVDQTLSGIVQIAMRSPDFDHVGWIADPSHPGLFVAPETGIRVDVQAAEVLFRDSDVRPVPDSMAAFSDFETVFGREALQCAHRFHHEHRKWVEIIGDHYELLEWDAPQIEDQGVGFPSPVPSAAFSQPVGAPERGDVLAALRSMQDTAGALVHRDPLTGIILPAEGADIFAPRGRLIGLYFSGHWCPPCRQFTPMLRQAYEAMQRRNGSANSPLEVVYISTDRSYDEFSAYVAEEMPWLAVAYENEEMRKGIQQLFGVTGVPTLVIVDPADGQIITMNATDDVRQDLSARKFPWGQRRSEKKDRSSVGAAARPEDASMDESASGGVAGGAANADAPTSASADGPAADEGEDAEDAEGIMFEGLRFSRPYLHYFADPENPPEALPPTESWITPLLTPILEAIYPENPPDQKMSYSLFLPEQAGAADATSCRLIGMDDEGKDFATWKEVVCVRALNVVYVYNLLSHGRRMYRSCVFSSNAKLGLHSLPPMHWHAPPSKAIPKCILYAGGDWRRKRQPDPSLVIVRTEPISGRRETLVPTRNLAGVVPTALLDAMRFWQGSDLVIRGYPRARSDEWFGYSLQIDLEPAGVHGHCAFIRRIPITASSPSGASSLAVRSPVRADGSSESSAPAQDDDNLALPPPLVRTLSQQTRLTPLTSAGYSETAAAHALDLFCRADGRDDMALAEGWLSDPRNGAEIAQVEAASGHTSAAAPSEPPQIERFVSDAGGVRGDQSPPRGGARARTARSGPASAGSELVLFNLTRVPDGTPLVRVARTLARIEDLSHVLAWSTDSSRLEWASDAMSHLSIIELPRLKLRFQPRRVALSTSTGAEAEAVTRLYVVDKAGWYVSDLNRELDGSGAVSERHRLLAELLAGLPHSLILENDSRELQVLVPNHEMRRPTVRGEHFGNELIFDRSSESWSEVMSDSPYLLFPVHTSCTFLLNKTLDAALYMIVLRFFNRNYAAAFRMAESITVDVRFTATEQWVWNLLQHVSDAHPDAHAVRLKLLLALQFSSNTTEFWSETEQLDRYLKKLDFVSGQCLLTPSEERAALKMCKEQWPYIKSRLAYWDAQSKGLAFVKLAPPLPKLGGDVWHERVWHASDGLLDAADPLQIFKYEHPMKDDLSNLGEEDLMRVVLECDVIEDEESGNSRGLGVLFLYRLLTKQITCVVDGVDCAQAMGEISIRCLNARLMHWGQAGFGIHPSHSTFLLSTVIENPGFAWPPVPTDAPTIKLLQAGINLAQVRKRASAQFGGFRRVMGMGMMGVGGDDDDEGGLVARRGAPALDEATILRRMGPARSFYEFAEAIKTSFLMIRTSPLFDGVRSVRRREWAKSLQLAETTARRITSGRRATSLAFSITAPVLADDLMPKPMSLYVDDLDNDSCTLRPFTIPAHLEAIAFGELSADDGGGAASRLDLTAATLTDFGSTPLARVGIADFVETQASADDSTESILPPHAGSALGLPFPLDDHPIVQSPISKRMLERIAEDQQLYVRQVARKNAMQKYVRFLRTSDTKLYCRAAHGLESKVETDRAASQLREAIELLHALQERLRSFYEQDMRVVERAIGAIRRLANYVPSDATASGGAEGDAKADAARLRFRLQRCSGAVPFISLDFVTMALLSSDGVAELLHLNAHVEEPEVILQIAVLMQLHTSRAAQASRAQSASDSLIRQLGALERRLSTADRDLATLTQRTQLCAAATSRLNHACESTLVHLTCKRHCLRPSPTVEGEHTIDPRFLLFEYMFCIVLRARQVEMVESFIERARGGVSSCQQMIMGAGKTTVVGPLLALCLADGKSLVTQVMPTALLEMSRGVLRQIFTSILPKKIYTLQFDRHVAGNMSQDDGPASGVGDFGGLQKIHRIIDKLEAARSHRGIVCTTPESIKSLTLKFIEQLHALKLHGARTIASGRAVGLTGRADRADGRLLSEQLNDMRQMEVRSEIADELVRVFDLWRDGTLIMDEVDILLNPLKSELNFPIGERDPIDMSGDRWDLPIHILELIFSSSRAAQENDPVKRARLVVSAAAAAGAIDAAGGGSSSDGDASPRSPSAGETPWDAAQRSTGINAAELIGAMAEVLNEGWDTYKIKRIPHLVLMDRAFYNDHIRPLAAQWTLLWVQKNAMADVALEGERCDEIVAFLEGTLDRPWETLRVAGLDSFTMKLLNLAAGWIQSFLPHSLAKINRVAFGLLADDDPQMLSSTTPQSRKLMAVPFVGKDVPSRSSEFAHPDVLIGLTVIGYRTDGLRLRDIRHVVKTLKADFVQEIGAKHERASFQRFDTWKMLGRKRWNEKSAPPRLFGLDLFQPDDAAQARSLHALIGKLPEVVDWFLCQLVFPETMTFQHSKISACGHELGSSMLFGRRIGFSGTPSNLMPLDLGECQYEPGSDGKIMHYLTSNEIVTAQVLVEFSPHLLLESIASHDPPYHALIDTGALVTGMENAEVAAYLLRRLPSSYEGCVFLDKLDRQMVLLRNGRSVQLLQCGVPLEKRFTFYDQVHTTGMDIKQTSTAVAVVTVGKDMSFRDYAQGSFRMRGIGKGQTLHVVLIPEVAKMIEQELGCVPGLFQFHADPATGGDDVARPAWPLNVPAWLLLNSMRSENLQFLQLQLQELHNVFRKRAFAALTDEVREHRKGSIATQPAEERIARFADGYGKDLSKLQQQLLAEAEDARRRAANREAAAGNDAALASASSRNAAATSKAAASVEPPLPAAMLEQAGVLMSVVGTVLSRKTIRQTLDRCDGNLDRAVEMLLTNFPNSATEEKQLDLERRYDAGESLVPSEDGASKLAPLEPPLTGDLADQAGTVQAFFGQFLLSRTTIASLLRRAGGNLERAVGILFQEPPSEAEESTLIAREHASDSGVPWFSPDAEKTVGGDSGGAGVAAVSTASSSFVASPGPLKRLDSAIVAGARDSPASKLRVSIDLFREPVSHAVASSVAKPQRFIETIDEIIAEHTEMLQGTGLLDSFDAEEDACIESVRTNAISGSAVREDSSGSGGGVSGDLRLDEQREKEQEAEKEKQKQREREEEQLKVSQFARDDEQPNPWLADQLTLSPAETLDGITEEQPADDGSTEFSELQIGDMPFYPLSKFAPRSGVQSLSFPPSLLVSSNWFRPRWAGLGNRRLKNVVVVMEWSPRRGADTTKQSRYLCALTLAEAEAVRRVIHMGKYGELVDYGSEANAVDAVGAAESLQFSSSIRMLARELGSGNEIALRVLGGHVLDCTTSYDVSSSGADPTSNGAIASGMQCFRFFNNEMFYNRHELELLVSSSLGLAPLDERREFFEDCLRRRRRSRHLYGDTPVARVFSDKSDWSGLRVQALIDTSSAAMLAKLRWVLRTLASAEAHVAGLSEQSAFETTAEYNERVREPQAKALGLRSKVEGMPTSFAALFQSFVPDAEDKLNRANLQRMLKEYLRADLAIAATDISAIMRLGDADGDGMLSFREYVTLFVPTAYQVRDATSDEVVDAKPVTLRASADTVSKDGGLELLYWQRPDLIPPDPPGFWSCPSCSLLNDDWRFFCKACMTPKPARLQTK